MYPSPVHTDALNFVRDRNSTTMLRQPKQINQGLISEVILFRILENYRKVAITNVL